MLWRDTSKSFGIVSIALHWITAASVLLLLSTGLVSLYFLWFVTGLRGGFGWFDMDLHVEVGSITIPFIALRVFWRVREGHPQEPKQSPLLEKITAINWPLMLVLIVACFVSGLYLVFLHGNTLWWFGRIPLHPPIYPRWVPELTDLHDRIMMPIHIWIALLLAAIISTHIAGALKHWIFNRDGVLERMLRPGELRTKINVRRERRIGVLWDGKTRAGG